MKKFFFLVVVIALVGMSVSAQEAEQAPEQTQAQEPESWPIELFLTFINAGVGLHFPLAVEGSVELIRLGFEENKMGFVVSLSPFYFFGWVGGRMENVNTKSLRGSYNDDIGGGGGLEDAKFAAAADWGASFINPTIHWNAALFLFPDSDKFFLGPFMDFNWLFMNPLSGTVDVERFRFSAGLQAGRRAGDRIRYNAFSVELGYLLDGNHMPPQAGNIQIGPNDHKFSIKMKFGR